MSYAILDRILQKLKDLGMSPRDASISSGHSADLIRTGSARGVKGGHFRARHMLASLAPVLGSPGMVDAGRSARDGRGCRALRDARRYLHAGDAVQDRPGARHLQTFVSSTSAAIIGGALLLAIKQMASAQLDTADSTLKSAQLLERCCEPSTP